MPQKYRVHSFRGLLADGGEDEINLERQNLNMAYRIIKFEIIPNNPGTQTNESVVQVFRETQSSASAVIDFSDVDLLAAACYVNTSSSGTATNTTVVVIDNILFSRNIYVTHVETNGNEACNYYLEIEEVPVSSSTLMQLKLGVARKLNLQQD